MRLHIVPDSVDVARDPEPNAPPGEPWLDALPVGVLAFAGHDVVGVNTRWTELTGLDLAHSAADGWLRAFHGDDRDAVRRFLASVRAGSDATGDWRLVGRGRSDVWTQGRAHHVAGGAPVTRVMTFTELDARQRVDAELLHLATHDSLTGLLNRRAFLTHLNAELDAAHSKSELLAVLFIDLDRFKRVNDERGHHVGDSLLAMACQRIRSSLRSTDCAGRLGGDELGVVCPSVTSKGEALGVAQRIVRAVGEPFDISGERVSIGASVGVAFSGDALRTAETLLREADEAMYRAKAHPSVGDLDTREHGGSMSSAATATSEVLLAVTALWRHSMDRRDEARVERLADAGHALRHAAELLQADDRLG